MKRLLYAWVLLLGGLLALGLTAGCDDDGDGGGETTTVIVVTNEVTGAVTTNVVVTGDGDADGDGVGDDVDGDGDVTLPSPAEVVLTAPLLTSPADEEVQVTDTGTKSVTFRWNAVGGASGYVFKLKNAETPVEGTSLTQILEASSSSYYSWKVQAVRGDESGPFSPSRKLYVRNLSVAVIPAPALGQPDNGRHYTGSGSISVAFQWDAVAGADRYTLEVNGTAHEVSGTSRTISYSSRGFEYSWRVRAWQGSTAGTWSSTRNFSIN